MSPAAARVLTRLYSPPWRARYEAELRALLEDLPLTPFVVADILPRALYSHKRAFGFAVAVCVLLALGSLPEQKLAPRVQIAQAVCRSYSSAVAAGWMSHKTCLT